MPVSYSLTKELLRLDLIGDYQPMEVAKAFLGGLNDPACPDPVALLVDVTNSTSLQRRTSDDVQFVSEFLGPYAARIGGRVAVLATHPVHFGLSRMGSVYAEGVGVQAAVFRDLEAALEWLGVGAGPAPGA